jgi:serine/threonine protein kinase
MANPLAYRLVEISAAGTFGTVCIAHDLSQGKLVALKVLKESHLHRPRVLARTRDEAALMAQLDDPHIVDVEGLVTIEDRPVLVLEWVRGLSLEQVLRAKKDGLPMPVAVDLIRRAAMALGTAYTTPDSTGKPMKVIHRDVKPSNMLLSVDGEFKLVDFGIARGEFEGKEAQTLSMVLGARGYLAPERLDGYDDKPSCDVYSLGICMYEFLAGRHIVLSVHKDFHKEALQKHLDALQPEGLSEEGTVRLRQILEGMCEYDESERPSYEELVAQFDDFLATYDVKPDLPAYAREHVLPLFKARHRVRPIDHPAYPELAFVERNARGQSFSTEPDVDKQVRAFLKRPDWFAQREELEVMLVKNPHWSPAPFLEVLPKGDRAWWQFWGGTELPSDQTAYVLGLLRDKPDQAVKQRCKTLLQHSDATVAQAAQQVVNA